MDQILFENSHILAIAVCYVDKNTSSDVDMTAMSQTFNGTTALDEMSTSTEDWRALTTDVNVSRHGDNTTTETVRSNKLHWLFQLPSWVFDNDSFADQSMLEEMIKKHKHDMVPPPGKQSCI